MEFQPHIGQDVIVKTTEKSLLLCTYLGLAFQNDVCVHVYKHQTSEILVTSEEQFAVPYEKACTVFN